MFFFGLSAGIWFEPIQAQAQAVIAIVPLLK